MGSNFNAISDISILSWRILEKKLPINVIEREVAYIKGKSHYNMYLMWFFVSLAGGSLAYIFGGDHHNSYLDLVCPSWLPYWDWPAEESYS